MIVCDLCGDSDTLWEDGVFALCEDHCREVLAKGNMADEKQTESIKKALALLESEK